jgi:hypothetical protein
METTRVSGESRSIWGKTGVFRENRVYGDNGSIWTYTLFSLNIPVFSQILLFSPDTPVVSIYSVFSKYSRFPPRYSCFLQIRENRVYGDNGSIWRKQEYLGENGNI